MNLNIKYIKIFSEITLGTNLVSLILGVFHYLIGNNLFFGASFSIIIVLAWFFNICLIVLDEYKTIKNTKIGRRLNLLGYGYLSFQIIAILLLVAGLFFLNADWFSPLLEFSLILSGFFGLFIYGILFSYMNYRSVQNREVWTVE